MSDKEIENREEEFNRLKEEAKFLSILSEGPEEVIEEEAGDEE